MLPQQQHRSRINLHDVKAQIVKRIGTGRASQYFAHFRSFISSRIGKRELDKLVFLTIGKENVALHNQLVRAVLHNAIHAELPPTQDISKPVRDTRPHIPTNDFRANAFNSSPRKGRSDVFDGKGNNDSSSPVSSRKTVDDTAMEFGDHNAPDLHRPLQAIQDAAQQLDTEHGTVLVPAVKRLRMLPRIDSASAEAKRGSELELCEEMLQPASYFIRASAARRPSVRGFPAHLLLGDGVQDEANQQASDLPDAESMHRLMEQVARREGVECVSRECAELLNHALDALMKRLIKACVDLVGSSRSGQDQQRHSMPMASSGSVRDKNMKMGVVSGINFPHPIQICTQDRPPISLADFKVAMDLHPQQLGEDWPVQLEKLASRIFDQ